MNDLQGFVPLLWAQAAGRKLPPAAKLYLYRGRTLALLRRYYRVSFSIGRMPALLGREIFRSKVTRYRSTTLEDSVIFVHDMEKCLARLDGLSQMLLARVVLQEHTQEEVAALLDCTRWHVMRRFPQAVDRLSQILLESGLLDPLPCQDPDSEENSPTDSQQSE